MSAMFLSFIIPFLHHVIDLNIVKSTIDEHANQGIQKIIYSPQQMLMGFESEEHASSFKNLNITFQQILYVIYGLGVFVLLFRFLINLRNVFLLIKRNRIEHRGKWKLIILRNELPSFSFFNYVFINQNDLKRNAKEVDQIIQHELMHVVNRHTFDIIFIELVTIVLWFNPFMFLYKRSIKQIHEFHADAEASSFTGTRNYAMLLVGMAASQRSFSLVSNFSKKQLKQRIIMLNSLKSNKMTKFRYFLIFPLVGMLTFVACNLAPVDAQEIEKASVFVKSEEAKIPSIFPVDQVEGVGISSKFEKMINPITKKEVFHKGIDIKAPEGTSIFATADGTILKARYSDKGYGNVIYIEHADNYVTVYAHMKDFSVRVGQKVEKGDVIGTIGNTGMSTAPHLHYEVRKSDENQNPMDYIGEFVEK